MMFISTLRAPYYEKIIGNVTKNLLDMVITGEIIENAIKNGKLKVRDTSEAKKGVPRKK